jgi:hypothetical protein
LASNGQVHAKVGGVGTWVNPSTLVTQRQVVVLQSFSSATQVPVSNDVPQTVVFGGAAAGADASIDSGGIITINTTGFYSFKFNLSFGRTSAVGVALLFARLLVNGTPQGFVQGIRLPDEDTTSIFQADVDLQLAAATTVRVEMYRDAAGATNGGLIPVVTGLAGWDDVPSAWVRVSKMIGTTN